MDGRRGVDARRSAEGRLATSGFLEVARARRLLGEDLDVLDPTTGRGRDEAGERLLALLARAADPDAALLGLVRLAEVVGRDRLLGRLAGDPGLTGALVHVLGSSTALADHLVRHPGDLDVLSGLPARGALDVTTLPLLPSTEALDEAFAAAVGPGPADREALDALRAVHRRYLLPVVARDLAGADVETVTRAFSGLADAVLRAGLALARRQVGVGDDVRLGVVALGKLGARELNLVSDVDLLVLAEPADAHPQAVQVVHELVRVVSTSTAEGSLWPVDLGLRPEGRNGPLVRTLTSALEYYRRHAHPWELQALLKARAVAGDGALAQGLVDATRPLVWDVASRDGFVGAVRTMRRRVEEGVPVRESGRQIKLGGGGIRDVEMPVQLLQLVHGRTDERLRQPATLPALRVLAEGGYVGRADVVALADSYRWLRRVEHRLQLLRLQRTALLPADEAGLRRLARSLGLMPGGGLDVVDVLRREHRRRAAEVRGLATRLYARPLLPTAASLVPDADATAPGLTPPAARDRLGALGLADPAAALAGITALTGGVSRRARLQRVVLPTLLAEVSRVAADPDAALLAYRRLSEAAGAAPWFLRLLREEGTADEPLVVRLAHVLAAGRYAGDLLERAPEGVRLLVGDDELRPRGRDALVGEARALVSRRTGDEVRTARAVRGLRRRELLRTAAADVLGLLAPDDVAAALTDVVHASVAAALDASTGDDDPALAVLALGRVGAGETQYGSDVDVLVVHRARDGQDPAAVQRRAVDAVARLRHLLARPAPDPPLVVDVGLRPEGRGGALSVGLETFRRYLDARARGWEAQALLRAVPLAGDEQLLADALAAVDRVRHPADGLDTGRDAALQAVHRRVAAERRPRGERGRRDLKLCAGGLADVELVTGLLQLRHVGRHPSVGVPGVRDALIALADVGVLDDADRDVLLHAHRLCGRLRDVLVLVTGWARDDLPTSAEGGGRVLDGVARLAPVDEFADATAAAAAVCERLRSGLERRGVSGEG